ncbi:protein of unknown function [Pseudomonas sp. JV241A]|nr:protein of unknown function [Pseudomonas sp. JV241A]
MAHCTQPQGFLQVAMAFIAALANYLSTTKKTLFAFFVYKRIIHPCNFLTQKSTNGPVACHPIRLTEPPSACAGLVLENKKRLEEYTLWKAANPTPLRWILPHRSKRAGWSGFSNSSYMAPPSKPR